MKKIVLWMIVSISFLAMILFTVKIAKADISQNPILPSDKTHHGFFIRTNEKVEVNGEVIGDVLAAGNDIIINGKVHGSVYALGQNIIINGVVDGNAQVVASKFEINGWIGGANYALANDIKTTQQSSINNGAILVGSMLDLVGPINNQAILIGSMIKLNSLINGNLMIMGSRAELGSNAKILGDLKHNQDLQISITNDKAISGSIIKTQEVGKKSTIVDQIRGVLFAILMSLITGLIIIALLPKSTQAMADHISRHLVKSFLAGIGFIILAPVVIFILLVTFFGLQIGILLALGYIAILMIGELFVAICIGNFITRPKEINFVGLATSLVIGLIVLAILKLIPYLGGLTAFVVFVMGAGAVFSRILSRLKTVRAAQLSTIKSRN